MNSGMKIIWAAIVCVLAGSLVGCASGPQAPVARRAGNFYVPSTALRGTEVAADYVLPTNSLAEAYIPRGERVAFGPPTAEFSAFTVYTFDQQRIGEPWSGSYQYRYVVRSGITLP